MMSESNIECRNEIAMSMADIGDEVEKDQSSTLSQLDNTEDQNHASQETSMVGGILEQATKDTPKPSAPAREENKGNDSPASGPSVSMTNEISQDTLVHPPPNSRSLNGEVAYSWLKDLSSRMSSLEVNANKSKDPAIPAKAEAQVAEVPGAYMSGTIPEVRECNWEQFKNRFPDDKGVYAIEVLPRSMSLEEEIEIEQLKRLSPERQLEVLAARKKSSRRQHVDSGPERLERVRINSGFVLAILAQVTGEKWAQKPHTFLRPFKTLVHYHKQMEAEYLKLQDNFGTKREKARTMGNFESTDQDENNEIVIANTATKAHPITTSTTSQVPGKTFTESTSDPLAANMDKEAVSTKGSNQKAFEDMACYIDFMRTRLIPLYTMFDRVDFTKPTKVRYHDLWSLFRVGELVVFRSATQFSGRSGRGETRPSGIQRPSDVHQTVTEEPLVGRVFWIGEVHPDWNVDDLFETGSRGRLHRDEGPDGSSSKEEETSIGVYYIDHNGKEYRAVDKNFQIDYFRGERDITSLPVSPLRFVKDHKQILQRLQTRGHEFRAIVGQGHSKLANLSYQGWTLSKTPLGEPIRAPKGLPISVTRTPRTYIDSDIIVDFHEAYQSRPWWTPPFSMFSKENLVPQTAEDRFSIIRWADKDRKKALGRDWEVVLYDDAIQNQECDQLLDTLGGRFLLDPQKWTPDQITAGHIPSEEDLVLLPSRICAYALRERNFILADLRFIKQNVSLDAANAFGALRIPDKHKILIQSVVFEHFEKKEAQKQGITKGLEISDQDFIRGKGRGLVILLHGAPGVGKTATAEAVAYAYNKPLFPITCGNLGVDPTFVELNLTELFRLANLWDCILLLDEAEIFLSPRAKTDDNLQRNSLVSVFLRILEYYSGVIFLTTNRSGALDEAVKSRVHLSLLYPHLGHKETMSLFKMNIDRLAQIEKETAKITGQPELTIEESGIMEFAQQHFEKFEEMEDTRWNGRQIRNAFQIAASLARYQNHRHPQRGLYIGAEHFQMVEDATFEYDQFRYRTAMKTDGEIAFAKGDRGPDRPQPHPAASGWRPDQRRPTDYPRYGATTSFPLGRDWKSSSNNVQSSSSRAGGGPRDNRGAYGGGTSWSSSGGSSTPTPNQAQRPFLGPHGSVGTDHGGDHVWDQRSGTRGSRSDYGGGSSWSSSGAPNTTTPGLAQAQTLSPSPHGSVGVEDGGNSGWDQRQKGAEAAGYPPGQNIYDAGRPEGWPQS